MKNSFLLAMSLILTSCGCEQVDNGHRGLELRFGEIQGEPKPEGLYFYNPITSSIKELNVQELKFEGETEAFTKDTQAVTVAFVATLYPDPTKIGTIYKEFGADWSNKVVPQIVLGSMKDVIGRYIADNIVGKRDEARAAAEAEIKANLATRHIIVTRLDFTNLNFNKAYEDAVEAKVTAVQKAAEAKNKTVEIEEQAKQKVIAATAEAESMRIRSRALSENKSLVEYETIQKWNGVLPQYMMGNSVPFMNIGTK